MADGTHIEWTDATWNIITGCSVVSAGCKHCYAMKLAGTRLRNTPSRAGLTIETKAGPVWDGTVRFNDQWLTQPLDWKRPRRIFPCAHGDLFHKNVPDEWIAAAFGIMAAAPQHTYQVLTKRADRALAWFQRAGAKPHPWLHEAVKGRMGYDRPKRPAINDGPWPLPNVWIGISVEDREHMLQRAPILQQIPAAVRWWSAEPLLGDIGEIPDQLMPHWIVPGGESGPGARPSHPGWFRSLRDQCAAAGVAYLHKQNGAWAETEPYAGGDLGGDMRRGLVQIVKRSGENDGHARRGDALMRLVGKKEAGRLLDGVQHDGFPVDQHGDSNAQ